MRQLVVEICHTEVERGLSPMLEVFTNVVECLLWESPFCVFTKHSTTPVCSDVLVSMDVSSRQPPALILSDSPDVACNFVTQF